jgi:competence ComEA-like helix-hairpin-helix protein
MWKKFISDYLNFTKKERTGIIVLLVLIVFFSFLPFFYAYFIKEKHPNATAFKKEIATLQLKEPDSTKNFAQKNFDEDNYPNYYQPSETNKPKFSSELFYFDPNTATIADWKKLGLRDKNITTIQKYISKGGRFYKPEDIGKIWGLHQDEVQRLLPFVQIKSIEDRYPEKSDAAKFFNKPKNTFTIIDINNADTAILIALPGIGSKLAQRIINFRDKLGGFYSIQQVAETFGLPDSTFQKIKVRLAVNSTTVKQFNINTATVDELKAHPYIRYNIANAIVQYRMQHGNFASVAVIKNIMLITDDLFNKLEPYLIVE